MNLTKYLSRIPKIAPVPHRTILSVSGTDASLFLNGLLTTQVLARPFFSAILNPQGRVLYDVLVYTRRVPEHQFLLEYDSRTSSDTPSLLTWLKKFVLRSKVKVRDVSHEYDIWAVWNSSTSRIWDTERRWQSTTSGVLEQIWDYEQDWPWGTGDEALHDRRSIGMGERLLIRKGSKPPHASDHDVVASEDYLTHRIIHGVAEGFDDMPPGLSFPMDSNLDIMGGLNFRKGCYVGQELTVRTYHTGVIRKRILPVIIHEQAGPLQPGLDIKPISITDTPRPRIRGSGKLLSSSNGVGLALMRLEHVAAAEAGSLAFEMRDGDGKVYRLSHATPVSGWPKLVIPGQTNASGT